MAAAWRFPAVIMDDPKHLKGCFSALLKGGPYGSMQYAYDRGRDLKRKKSEALVAQNRALFRQSFEEKSVVAKHSPIRIMLSVTNACNLHCAHCRDTAHLDGHSFHMRRDVIDKTMDAARKAELLQTFGYGEPLMYPQLLAVLKDFRRTNPSAHISFSSNGLLVTREIMEELIGLELGCIGISMESVNEKTYADIRRGGTFKKLVEKIDLINDTKRAFGSQKPRLDMAVVVMKQNIEELPDIARFAIEKRFSHVYLSEVQKRPEYRVANYARYREKFLAAGEMLAEAGIVLDGPFPAKNPALFGITKQQGQRRDAPSSQTMCVEPWRSVYINAGGHVFPCCAYGVPKNTLGDLKEQSLEDIWNGPGFQELRRSMIEGHYLPPCRNCPRMPMFTA
jgi:radical SAM protein with 4Fe4S-binding SPASM domain